jgi:hypothetical protein
MSYVGLGGNDVCDRWVIRADGRCFDPRGIRPLSWYSLDTGICLSPPPITCDVNAPNLPSSCPPGEMLHGASEDGCIVSGAAQTTIPGFPGTAPEPAPAPAPAEPPVTQRAGVGVGAIAAVALGVVVVAYLAGQVKS